MDTALLDALIDSAYEAAMRNPQRVQRHSVSDNATLQTEIYESPEGSGFRVVCIIFDGLTGATVARVLNHGSDTQSARDWPGDIEAELRRRSAFDGRLSRELSPKPPSPVG